MKSFFKKTIFFLIFFTVFSIVVNSVFLGLIATSDWDFVKRLESLRFENPDYECLILGTSLAEYGVDAEVLTQNGVKSYNLAFVGSSVKTNYIQLEEYLNRYSHKPKYVILALNSQLERFDQDGIQPVVEFTMKGHKYGIKDVPISKFRWAGMELLKKAIRSTYRKTEVVLGQKRSITKIPDPSDYNKLTLNIEKYESAIWMGKIAESCAKNGIKFIAVEIPVVNESQNSTRIGPFPVSFENGFTASLYNFNNKDFCKFIDVDNDWSGMSHFNKYGADKFTREMMKFTMPDEQ